MKTLIVWAWVGLLLPVAAFAQEWQVFTYSDPGFAIQFPALPAVETSRVKYTAGVSLAVTRYSVSQEHITYTLSVVNYSNTNADALSTIADTVRSLSTTGKVTADNGARVNGSHGRRLSISGADGSREAIAVFFVDKHLYTAIGQASPNALDRVDDAIRFRDSLEFIGEGGGFSGFLGHSSSSDTPSPSATPSSPVHPPGSNSTGVVRSSGPYYPKADAACAGKSAGDSVQLDTPNGPVAATCTLVARPNAPPAAHSPDSH